MWAELLATFHNMSPHEKEALAVGVVGVAGLAYYLKTKKSQQQQATTQPNTGDANNTVFDVYGNGLNGQTNTNPQPYCQPGTRGIGITGVVGGPGGIQCHPISTVGQSPVHSSMLVGH